MSTIMIIDITSLRVLDVNCNRIGDDGMSLISDEFQHSSVLTELSVSRCDLSAKGIYYIVYQNENYIATNLIL